MWSRSPGAFGQFGTFPGSKETSLLRRKVTPFLCSVIWTGNPNFPDAEWSAAAGLCEDPKLKYIVQSKHRNGYNAELTK